MGRTKRYYEDVLDEDTAEIEEGIRLVLYNHNDAYDYKHFLDEVQEVLCDHHTKLNLPLEDTFWDVAQNMIEHGEISVMNQPTGDNYIIAFYFMNLKQRWKCFSENYEWKKRMLSRSSSSENTPVAANK